jgi:tetratricopeptide (TPR) repeat protein
LRAVIDWSWEPATEPEHIVLRRLAVHTDGCTLTAAEQTCAGEGLDRADIAGLLARLVDRSLVAVTAEGALEGAIRHHEADLALRLAGAMTWYWFLRGRLTEARRALASALAADGDAPEPARAFAAAWLAGIRLLAGGDGDAAAARELGLWPQAADRLTWLGRIAMLTGDYAQARELLEEARRLAAERAYKPGEIFADISLGALARREGDLDNADARLRQVLDWHAQMGYAPDVGKAMALAELGYVAEQRGDPAAARHCHAEALAITRELGDPHGIALILEGRIRTT